MHSEATASGGATGTLGGLGILIVDDQSFQRSMMARILRGLGITAIHEAADGSAALAIIRDPELPVDIVISDLDMPGMDGLEFIRHLGESGVRISIILASAIESTLLASIATMSEAYGIRLLGVVEKPASAANLLPLIELHIPEKVRPQRAADRIFSLGEIAGGLSNDEFEPFFQPKVSLATGKVHGTEALARWRHAGAGIVAPYAFIARLEDNGRIDDLTWVMLRKAAAHCHAWREAGLDINVSVNLSVRSLADVTVAERVTALVQSQGLAPRDMVLEVTESAATTLVGQALENLARLRMKGFGLSIDDYGTGYSSMQQLTRIAFSEIKVDQSFVMNAARQKSARVILESSLAMATKLGITSVAEGVETRADYDLLRALGSDLAQGYFIAKPMAADAFLAWAQEWDRGAATAAKA
jgi:EAL domain-containing protein (putative c-di-GMP-specific phosphodiesterase class I)/AmiR/NasT family two-component response regulator